MLQSSTAIKTSRSERAFNLAKGDAVLVKAEKAYICPGVCQKRQVY